MTVKVLIVDDSLFIRSLVSDFLNKEPGIKVVDTASSGQEALSKIPVSRPDCVVLDLAMPGMDGMTTLKYIMRDFPTPVVILSAYTRDEADITLKCLELGAISFVPKPSGELSLDVEDVKERLVREIKAVAKINLKKSEPVVRKRPPDLSAENRVIVIGSSTGGSQALELILSSLPADFSIPVIVCQHFPNHFFSEGLVDQLNKNCLINARMACDNKIISTPAVYVVPGGSNLTIDRNYRMSLTEALPNTLSPSIDITMQSIAGIYKGNSIGIILSGIGNDGVEGMRAIKEEGGRTIVQDESAIIFGMSKSVIDARLADKVLPVQEIGQAILEEEK